MSSAQIEEPPSESKRDLIKRFLCATGIQTRIDTGSFLERYAFPGTRLFMQLAEKGVTFGEGARQAMQALRVAYEPHRQTWQEEYEGYVNWEFGEGELRQIVDFLETAEGQHFLEGRWRMDAYIGTNTEDIVEQIVAEAENSISAHD